MKLLHLLTLYCLPCEQVRDESWKAKKTKRGQDFIFTLFASQIFLSLLSKYISQSFAFYFSPPFRNQLCVCKHADVFCFVFLQSIPPIRFFKAELYRQLPPAPQWNIYHDTQITCFVFSLTRAVRMRLNIHHFKRAHIKPLMRRTPSPALWIT